MPKGLSDVQLKALLNNPPPSRIELQDDKVDGLSCGWVLEGAQPGLFGFEFAPPVGRLHAVHSRMVHATIA